MPRSKKQPDPPRRRAPGTGSVGARTNGRIFVKLPKDLDPKQQPHYGSGKRQRFQTLDEAVAWLDAEVYRLRNPTARSVSLSEPLGAYLARWYDNNSPSMPPRTAQAYLLALRRWQIVKHVPVGEFTREAFQGALAELIRSTWRRKKRGKSGRWIPYGAAYPYSVKSLRLFCSVLHQALQDLVPDTLAANPTQRPRIPKVQPSLQPVWDANQTDRFLATADRLRPDLALAFRLVLRRALRRGEVLVREVQDVDERRAVLIVDDTAGLTTGQTGDTKGRQQREIPLSAELMTAIREHRKRQAKPSRWLFPGPNPAKPLSVRSLNRVAHVISDAAGLPRIGPKDMRATAATILLDENVSLARVSRLLGHSTVAITAKFYDRVLASREQRTARLSDEFDAAFARASEAGKQADPVPFPPSGVSLEVSGKTATR